jgi:hypothetical protein
MQFKVPQFLDIEDKIFGPFTFREFIYLAGGAGLCFTFYKWLGLLYGAIPIVAVGGFAGALTFFKPNNKPFLDLIEAWFKYFTQNKLYIWKKHAGKPAKNAGGASEDKNEAMEGSEVRLSGSKLRDLAWSLDVLDLSKEKK